MNIHDIPLSPPNGERDRVRGLNLFLTIIIIAA